MADAQQSYVQVQLAAAIRVEQALKARVEEALNINSRLDVAWLCMSVCYIL